ncbi:MAG: hypothetical protein K8R74_13570, partial [Bacteroidales bacterium]|nr:hypothetical protein [Bacteroidales bacterium]
ISKAIFLLFYDLSILKRQKYYFFTNTINIITDFNQLSFKPGKDFSIDEGQDARYRIWFRFLLRHKCRSKKMQ